MRSFTDRVAVITGAGSGIGRALARDLAGRGCDVALVDVAPDRLPEVEQEIVGLGRRASRHVVDVADKAAMQALPDAVMAAHGRVDILVNNAGVAVSCELADHTLEDFEWIVGINFWGVVYGCKFFLPHLRASDDGYIVNLSSMFGLIGIPGQSAYCATKFAVRGFSEAIAAELADTKVRVMSVHPGGIRTNIARDGRCSPQFAARRDKIVEFFATRTMPAERCAAQISAAMLADKQRLVVTAEAKATDAIKRLFPALPQRWIARGSKRFMR